MVIPDDALWSALGAFGAVVSWLLTVERRLSNRLTRSEHTKICDKANAELSHKLDKITSMLEKSNEASLLHRQLMGDSVAEIRTNIAVLQERLPPRRHDPDSGPHLRRI